MVVGPSLLGSLPFGGVVEMVHLLWVDRWVNDGWVSGQRCK